MSVLDWGVPRSLPVPFLSQGNCSFYSPEFYYGRLFFNGVKFMCMYVHGNMWPLTDTYIEDEREKWTTYNYRYFRSSGIQMISPDSDSFDKSVY